MLVKTLRNTFFATLYIFVVSQIMQNGSKLFGEHDNMLTPFVLLLLFTLSAAIVGGLIFGETLYLFFNDQKKESIKAAYYSVGWLGLFTLLGLFALALIR